MHSAVARFAQICIVVAADDLVSRTLMSNLMEQLNYFRSSGSRPETGVRSSSNLSHHCCEWPFPSLVKVPRLVPDKAGRAFAWCREHLHKHHASVEDRPAHLCCVSAPIFSTLLPVPWQ